MEAGALSANWQKLQTTLTSTKTVKPSSKPPESNALKRKRAPLRQGLRSQPAQQAQKARKRQRMEAPIVHHHQSGQKSTILDVESSETAPRVRPERVESDLANAGLSPGVEIGKYVAIDCEMVGVGPNPDRESALARASIVNYNGEQVYDSFVIPKEPVTDWRTAVSGIAPHHMKIARTMEEVQSDVSKIIKDKILIGHAIRNDLEALMLSHSKRDIRDTARHAPYRKLAGGGSPRLKILASELLGFDIQEGAHSSVEDARACMLLFRRDKPAFEREHAKKWPVRTAAEPADAGDQPQPKKPHKKKKKKRH